MHCPQTNSKGDEVIETSESRRDETLALGLYTGVGWGTVPRPKLFIASFNYTTQRKAFLEEVAAVFGDRLTRPLSQKHSELLKRGEEQSPSDKALVKRMGDVQREALKD
jgi:hypothetical protein